jgi:hypothetical protein
MVCTVRTYSYSSVQYGQAYIDYGRRTAVYGCRPAVRAGLTVGDGCVLHVVYADPILSDFATAAYAVCFLLTKKSAKKARSNKIELVRWCGVCHVSSPQSARGVDVADWTPPPVPSRWDITVLDITAAGTSPPVP